MLVKGETFNQRKKQLLDLIKSSRQMIKAISDNYHTANKDLAYLVINLEQQLISGYMVELVELKKWNKARRVKK